jgi:hypothetical protein
MSEQWEEIKIEDVRPGDVARCNGREFPVVHWFGEAPWVAKVGRFTAGPEWGFFKSLGFTFHRRVKRSPLSVDITLASVDVQFNKHMGESPVTKFQVAIPGVHFLGKRFRITEILDGEDGA